MGKVDSLAVTYIARLLEWQEPAVSELAAKAEVTVFRRGWTPVRGGTASRVGSVPRRDRGRPSRPAAGCVTGPGAAAEPATRGDHNDTAVGGQDAPAGITCDHESVPADVLGSLRTALTSGEDADAAVRQDMYRNPVLCSALFDVSIRHWFGLGCDIRDVTRFIARNKAHLPTGAIAARPRDAELMIRISLGEHALMRELDVNDVDVLEIMIAVLAGLFAERRPEPAAADALFAQVESVIEALSGHMPEAAGYLRDMAPQLPPELWSQAITYLSSSSHHDEASQL